MNYGPNLPHCSSNQTGRKEEGLWHRVEFLRIRLVGESIRVSHYETQDSK